MIEHDSSYTTTHFAQIALCKAARGENTVCKTYVFVSLMHLIVNPILLCNLQSQKDKAPVSKPVTSSTPSMVQTWF